MELQKCLNDVGLEFSQEQCESLEALFSMIHCDEHLNRILKTVKNPLIEGLSKSEHQYLEIVTVTQRYLLRPKGVERDHLIDYADIDRAEFLQHAQKIGLVDAILPPRNDYPVVALLAGYEFRTIERLRWLIDKMQNGIVNNVKVILVCAGERPLEKHETAVNYGCFDETEMVKYLMEKYFPFGQFPGIEIIYSNAPKEKGDVRARTDGAAHYAREVFEKTVISTRAGNRKVVIPAHAGISRRVAAKLKKIPALLSNTLRVLPKAGMTVLVITNQPYCEYQGMVYQQVFYPAKISSSGAAASNHCTEQDIYDSLARYFYANALRYFVTRKKLSEKAAKRYVSTYIHNI